MKRILLLLSLCIALCSFAQTGNYTIIVSLDGFRWDYPQKYDTPHLDKMANRGVSAVMLPSFPASTFPNHYTMATGLVPDHNGIINNTFWNEDQQQHYTVSNEETRYNPAYYLGEPIWITAQKQGVKTGVLYWVGSDIAIKDTYPTYYKRWDDQPQYTYPERLSKAISWLQKPEEERPQLVMIYIDEPDGVGHTYGPESKETATEIAYLDSLVGNLIQEIEKLPIADKVNLIVTSDHGMTEICDERIVDMKQYLKEEWCRIVSGSTPTSIFTHEGYQDSVYHALKEAEHIHVWKKEEIPAELHYGTSNRIGDIVVAPEIGWQFTDQPRSGYGAHGYFPQEPDMQVIFRAYGPDFKQGYTSNGFVNVDLYSLLAQLLKITPEETDGELERVKDMLK